MTLTSTHRSLSRRSGRSLPPLSHLFSVWRERRALSRLDDAALNDIGITREEAMIEARRPLWDAPQTWRK